MKRVRRYILNALTLLSLALCVTAGGFWVRSYSVGDLFYARTNGRWFSAVFWEGHVVMAEWSRAELDPSSLHPGHVRWPIEEARSSMKVHGQMMTMQTRIFGIEYRRSFVSPVTTREVGFSFGHLVALTGALPLMKTLVMIVRALRKGGTAAKTTDSCPACGYDLRATPDRCPECGTVPSAREEPRLRSGCVKGQGLNGDSGD